MDPQEIGSRFAALLAPGVPVTEPGEVPAGARPEPTGADVTPGTGGGPLAAPAAARAADAVSAQERTGSTVARTDAAGGPTTPPADADDERAARVRRAQEARAARAAAAAGDEATATTGPAGEPPAGGEAGAEDERAARIRRAQEARAAATTGGETAGAAGADDERAARVRRAQEARAAATTGGETAGAAGADDERAARIRRAQEARAARGGTTRPTRAAAPAAPTSAARTVGDISLSVSAGGDHARATVDVPKAKWAEAVRAARDDDQLACDYFDWLSAVDELADGFMVVAHLWSTTRKHGLLIRTRLGKEDPEVDTIVDVYPGANWHERETHEMFGIGFAGHADLKPLLLPPEFEGHPLRKDFVLASRVAKAWPGAKEPGESEGGGAKRAPMRPPGVPAPGEWGPA